MKNPLEYDETLYWLENAPTVAELQRLNRETLYTFPLEVLMALADAEVDFKHESRAVVRQVPWITEDLVSMQLQVELDGKLIAVLSIDTDAEGFTVCKAISKRRKRNLAQ